MTMYCFRCERPLFKRPDVVIPLPHGQEPAYYGPKCAILAGLVTQQRASRVKKAPQLNLLPKKSTRAPHIPKGKGALAGQIDWIKDLDAANTVNAPPAPQGALTA